MYSGITKQNPAEDEISHDYVMESNLFDYELLKSNRNFGIKVFHNAVFKGILINGS